MLPKRFVTYRKLQEDFSLDQILATKTQAKILLEQAVDTNNY